MHLQYNKDPNEDKKQRALEEKNLKKMIELLIERGIKVDEMDE